MRYARRAANSDLIKDVLNLVAASLGIRNHVKGPRSAQRCRPEDAEADRPLLSHDRPEVADAPPRAARGDRVPVPADRNGRLEASARASRRRAYSSL